MIFEVVVRSLTEKDIQKLFDWYNLQQAGLSNNFLEEVSKGIAIIQQNPFIYKIRHKEIRIGYIKKFPFGIHYLIQKNL